MISECRVNRIRIGLRKITFNNGIQWSRGGEKKEKEKKRKEKKCPQFRGDTHGTIVTVLSAHSDPL